MQFEREELLSVLSDASPALAKSAEIPGLDHFWFDGTYVYAYNGGLGVRIALKTELKCGLPGKVLLDLLKTSALKQVDIEESKKGLVIKMSKSRVNLVSLDIKGNPWMFPVPSKKGPGQIVGTLKLTEEVLEAFTRVSFVRRVGKVTEIVHNGVSVIPQKKTTEFYTTDSMSLARSALDLVLPEEVPSFIAPWGFVDRFLSLLEPDSQLHVLEDCLVAEGEDVLVCSNILEFPDFPDMPEMVDKLLKAEKDGTELPAGLAGVLDRAMILSGASDPLVNITADGKAFSLEGRYGLGSLEEDLPVKTPLAKAEGQFHANILRRGLASAKTIELLPNVLLMRDGDSFIYLVSSVAKLNKTERKPAEKSGATERRKPLKNDLDDEIPF